MKKEGFTLVELLAVIAILAILIIIALPNILEMFNKAKRDSFVTEARSVYKTAQQRYVADGVQAECYSNDDVDCEDLQMSGRSNLYYYIDFDNDGNITYFGVWDDNYYVDLDDDGDPVEIEDINSSSVYEGEGGIPG
jgi:prepilin-type N-terminal cleavage/methylation domain-containing protein